VSNPKKKQLNLKFIPVKFKTAHSRNLGRVPKKEKGGGEGIIKILRNIQVFFAYPLPLSHLPSSSIIRYRKSKKHFLAGRIDTKL
jgi:hypothetical protein